VKRLVIILVILATSGGAPAPQPAHAAEGGGAPLRRCPARADVTGLPLIELPASNPSNRFAIMLTGDGGWRRIDRKVTDDLRAAGIPVVGFLTNDYFRTRRTPDESGCALERVIRYYKLNWKKSKVILIGYSRGADVLPFMTSRLPDDLRPSVQLIALLGLELTIDFKYRPFWMLHLHREPQFPVRPEVEKLRGEKVVCVYGEREGDSLCRDLDPSAFKVVREPGSHHFAGQYHSVAEVILSEAR
jgi:type IV secretory pathway VirJ component